MKLFGYISLWSLWFLLPLCAEESTFIPMLQEETVVEAPIESTVSLSTIEADSVSKVIVEAEVSSTPSVKELVTQVQNAPDGQKRVLMNQLKLQLKNMNKESRQEAMKALKKSFSKEKKHNHQEHNQPKHNQEECQHLFNHQPKFRHLQKGLRDGTGPKLGQQGNGFR